MANIEPQPTTEAGRAYVEGFGREGRQTDYFIINGIQEEARVAALAIEAEARAPLAQLREQVAALGCVELKAEVIRLSHQALDYPHDGSRETVYRLEVLALIDAALARTSA